ncbi:MAG TPA: hypothetical protein VFE36_04475 [Candidatus Baltobacteraceae bacterium]|nr:hypothetical protein [Candidatus Baltobacteraceae bacterium]
MAAYSEPKPSVAIVATIVWGLLLLPGLFAAAFSVMFFDAPGSMSNPGAWLSAGIVASFPVLCVVSIAGSWIVWMWRKRGPSSASNRTEIVVACLPLLPIAVVVILWVVAMIGVIASGQPLGLHSTEIKH